MGEGIDIYKHGKQVRAGIGTDKRRRSNQQQASKLKNDGYKVEVELHPNGAFFA